MGSKNVHCKQFSLYFLLAQVNVLYCSTMKQLSLLMRQLSLYLVVNVIYCSTMKQLSLLMRHSLYLVVAKVNVLYCSTMKLQLQGKTKLLFTYASEIMTVLYIHKPSLQWMRSPP